MSKPHSGIEDNTVHRQTEEKNEQMHDGGVDLGGGGGVVHHLLNLQPIKAD